MSKKEKEKKPEKKKMTKAQKTIMARTVQELLDFSGVTNDGIFIQGKNFSRLYALVDANYVTEPEEKQIDILNDYTKLVNRFPDNVDVTVIILNSKNTSENLAENFHLKEQGDRFDEYRRDYNSIIDAKIEEGHNDISKEKYILLTVRNAKDLDDADQMFSAISISLNDAVKSINKVGVRSIDTIERLSIMKRILCGAEGIPFEKEFEPYFNKSEDEDGNVKINFEMKKLRRSGMSVKDCIAPQFIERNSQYLRLDENRYVRSYAFKHLPPQLDPLFLTRVTNLPYEMVTVIQFRAVPRQTALRLVKNMNTSIKADVIKASQQAYRSGYDPSLMNDDLQQAMAEARHTRNDIVNEGKKLFFATMTISMFGSDLNELEFIATQFKSRCEDYTVTPSYLWGEQIEGLNTALFTGSSRVLGDRMLTSDNIQALFPFNIQELTDKNGHFYGINAVSKNMIMYNRKESRLANGLIFGQSGSGKSFITKGEIIPNILDGNDDIIILDPENEYRVIAENFGGTVIDLDTKADYHINPCDLIMEWDDRRADPLTEKCDYMVSLVESVFGGRKECNSYEVSCILRVCKKMYDPYIAEMERRHRQGRGNDILDTTICPTLADFYNGLLEDGNEHPEANKIASAMEPYCTGAYKIFSYPTNVEIRGRLVVYNLLNLPEKMKEMAMKVCLSSIWSRIVRNREENEKMMTNKAIWVYLDEFHLFFQTESSATTIMTYFKRVRKYGGIMTGITQDVADLLRNQQGTAMFNNTGFFIFLNQSPVGRQHLQALYHTSDSLIDFIKDKPTGMGLIYNNTIMIPFDYKLPSTSSLYKLMSTNPNDVKARKVTSDNSDTGKKDILAGIREELSRQKEEEKTETAPEPEPEYEDDEEIIDV